MSRSMNHERLKNSIRGQQGHKDELEYQFKRNRYQPEPDKWEPMERGRLHGLSAPAAFCSDLSRFYDTVYDYCIEGKYASTKWAMQARHVADCACNLRPPTWYSGEWEFLIVVDCYNCFLDILFAKKDQPYKGTLPEGSRVVRSVAVLDATLPYDYFNPRLGLKRMGQAIEAIYFPRDQMGHYGRTERHFEKPSNFELTLILRKRGMACGIFRPSTFN